MRKLSALRGELVKSDELNKVGLREVYAIAEVEGEGWIAGGGGGISI